MSAAPEAVTKCGYQENNRSCHEPPVCMVSIGGKRLGLCERHQRPELHPPDLHKRLRTAERIP